MKRYDLSGNVEQFGKKQFWVVSFNARYDAWVSYNTVVAIVDHATHEVIQGYAARGFSQTTSKQVTQACYEFAYGYEIQAYNSERYHEFNAEHGLNDENTWYDWDEYNRAATATYRLAGILG